MNQQSDELRISAIGRERPVALETKRLIDGKVSSETEWHNLVLIEMTYTEQESFISENARSFVTDARTGERTLRDVTGFRFILLKRCLLHQDSRKPVSAEWFSQREVTGATIQQLFEAAMKLNNMGVQGSIVEAVQKIADPEDMTTEECDQLLDWLSEIRPKLGNG